MTEFALALLREQRGRWFSLEDALPLARQFGCGRRALLQLLQELGPGIIDPRTGHREPGDGVLEVDALGRYSFQTDTSRRESVANPGESVASSPGVQATGSPVWPHFGAAHPVGQHQPLLDGPQCSRCMERYAIEHLDVAAAVKAIVRVLNEPASKAATLFRLSMTMPAWGCAFGETWSAASQFLEVQQQRGGLLGAVLAMDVVAAKAGGPRWHWYGFALKEGCPDREAASAQLKTDWVQASGASRRAVRTRAVTGWDEFVRTGDPNAKAGPESFLTHLFRVTKYTFKAWPAFGVRHLDDHVFERGVFVGATAAGRRAT